MKKRLPLWFLILAVVLGSCGKKTTTLPRQERLLTENWLFAKDLPNLDYSGTEVNDSLFANVTLPHTANPEPLVVNNQWQGTCWYRNWLTFNVDQKNLNHFLYFEGAMQDATIFFNGKQLTRHLGGYLPFVVDISDQIDYTKPNLLAVKLINVDDTLIPPGKTLKTLDFNMYGGLYRPVKLISTPRLYVTNPMQETEEKGGGIFVIFDSVSTDFCQMHVRTQIANDLEDNQTFIIRQTVVDSNNVPVAYAETSEQILAPDAIIETQQEINFRNPKLWSTSRPYLYQVITELVQKGKTTDIISTQVGIRSIKLSEDGLFVNGEKTYLRGTNRHQEYPYVGYALSDEAQWRDAVKIKNAGFDMVRLSHYPHSEAFMDACDALGIITMNCIPGWQYNGNEEFKENVLKDSRDLIRRDRNHPSVLFWELSLNESWMEPEFMDRILEVKKDELGNTPALTCAWIDYDGYDLFIPARQHGKPPAYWNDYKNGQRPVFIAEYGDWEYYAQNAGFNQTAYANLKADERTSRQSRGSGEQRLLQQALNYQEAANSNRKGTSTIGHANWLMFDYNRGYADDIEASGISDIFRIPKFAHYFYQSQRDPQEPVTPPATGGPMVFIASYWQPESSTTIRVFSNCEEVELRLNGKTMARQKPDEDANSTHLPHPPFTFHLDKFMAGQLEAFGIMDGIKVVRHGICTPESPARIQLRWDDSGKPLVANDLAFVYASVLDEHGTICPINGLPIDFHSVGDGMLMGENPMRTEAGIAGILLKTDIGTTSITIVGNSPGLIADTLHILIHQPTSHE